MMTELVHKKKTCTATDLCLGGVDGLFCGNCGAGLADSKCTHDNNTCADCMGSRCINPIRLCLDCETEFNIDEEAK